MYDSQAVLDYSTMCSEMTFVVSKIFLFFPKVNARIKKKEQSLYGAMTIPKRQGLETESNLQATCTCTCMAFEFESVLEKCLS